MVNTGISDKNIID